MPCPPFAAYSSHSTSEAQRSTLLLPFTYWELQTGQHGPGCSSSKQSWLFSSFFFLALATPLLFVVVLKGLTSLCGSRSLSCTDLINNFYQPLAQEISRGWAVGGRWECDLAGRGGVVVRCWLKTPGGRERVFDHVSATRDRGVHHD